MKNILSPIELNDLLKKIVTAESWLSLPLEERISLDKLLEKFSADWAIAYAQFGQNSAGELAYRDDLLFFSEQISAKLRKLFLFDSEGLRILATIELMLMPQGNVSPPRKILPRSWRQQQPARTPLANSTVVEFECPLFIVSAPRAGSSLLFESLSQFEEIWSIGKESHDIEADITYLHPASHGYDSNRLIEASTAISAEVKAWFSQRLKNHNKQSYFNVEPRAQSLRFLEKTPKNALRIPFLKQVFPDAKFIFLYRKPEENINSLLEFWRSSRFPAYKNMPGWPHKEWYGLLPIGWEAFANRPLVEITAHQWVIANQTILDDINLLAAEDWCFLSYDELIEQPAITLRRLCDFSGLQWTQAIAQRFSQPLPLSSMVISPPVVDKWRKNATEINTILTMTESIQKQINLL